MKKTTKQQIKPKGKSSNMPTKNYIFPNVSNENCIRIALKLLGVTDDLYEKQTKCSIKNELFPKNTTANASKSFFFICQLCIKHLCGEEQAAELMMWYPPRTANQQIQFKKSFFKIIQRLESQGSLPKNIILSKASIAGDPTNQAVIQFLRVLTQMALRTAYIEKYSKQERLVQVALTNSVDGDISNFYPFPFCESTTNVQPPLKGHELQAAKQVLKLHIQRYRQKILLLQAESESEAINPQQLMSQLMEQRQIANTLTSKVSNAVFSENRAFDRRVIIDKHRQLWKEIDSISCPYAEPTSSSVLRVQGDIAKLLSGWKTISGTHTVKDFNNKCQEVEVLRNRCEKVMNQFKIIKDRLLKTIK